MKRKSPIVCQVDKNHNNNKKCVCSECVGKLVKAVHCHRTKYVVCDDCNWRLIGPIRTIGLPQANAMEIPSASNASPIQFTT